MPLLILTIGITLVIFNYYAIKKDKKSFSNILNNQSFINKDYDVEMMAIRKDMAESILDLQKEIEELRQQVEALNNKSLQKDLIVKEDLVVKNEGVINDIKIGATKTQAIKNKKADRVQNIKAMIEDGYSEDEICNKLNIGKGEVLLIKGLFK